MRRFLLLFCLLPVLFACQKEDIDGGTESIPGGFIGWYAQNVVSAEDFKATSEAIQSFDTYTYKSTTYVISRDEFFEEDGQFNGYGKGYLANSNKRDLRIKAENVSSFINVIDENTLVCYFGYIYAANSPGTKGKTVLYHIDAGPVFGELVYCTSSNGTYYTCAKNGNKVISTSGDIYTISGNLLIQDGTASPFQKFNPTYLHGKDIWGRDREIYKKACASVNGWLNIINRDYYVGYVNSPDYFFTPVINAKSGELSGDVKYGWETGIQDYSQEKLFTLAELPGSIAYYAMNWDGDDYWVNSINENYLQQYDERYRLGQLTEDEYKLYQSLIIYSLQNREKALDKAEGRVRFFAEVDGKRYYVKMIHWSKKKGVTEYDNTTNSLAKPNITPQFLN